MWYNSEQKVIGEIVEMESPEMLSKQSILVIRGMVSIPTIWPLNVD
jgi:hypothetical protein